MKSWGEPRKIKKELNPQLLGQANIPKALHGINPRTIMGQAAWRNHRQQIIQNNPYCKACGLDTLTLDLHEDYKIDYNKCIMTLNDYVPLCKKCHSFIHSGLLTTLLAKQEITKEYVIDVLRHGLAICKQKQVSVFIVGYSLAKHLEVPVKGVRSWQPKNASKWGNWRLYYNGQYYKGMTYEQWKNKYHS